RWTVPERRAHRPADRNVAALPGDGALGRGPRRRGGDGHIEESREVTATVSVIIPVYNEEAGLETLFARLYPALDQLERPYEVIFIDDGSRDRSAAAL